MNFKDDIPMGRFKKGDEQVFAAVYNKYFEALYYFAIGLGVDPGNADEIIQDTFVKLSDRRAKFKREPSLRSFLYVTVRNACYDYLRKRWLILELSDELLNTKGDDIGADNAVIVKELLEIIRTAILQLPKFQRIVISLHIDGHSVDQIMELEGLDEQQIKDAKYEARKKLKEILIAKGYKSFLNKNPQKK